MQVEVKHLDSFTREIKIIVPWKELEKSFKVEFNSFRKKISMPGYRKGKVPIPLVKANYGKSFEVDFIDKNMDKYYRKALKSENFSPINRAQISDLNFEETSDLKFTAIFEVVPEYSLPDYNKIKISMTRYTSTDTDMEKALDEMQNKLSTLKTIEEGASSGHYVECDLEELDENNSPIDGKKQEGRFLRLGEGYIKNQAEETLLGIKAKENRTITVVMDNDAKVNYNVKARKVQELMKPELNDEFAKIADPNAKTLKELKNKIQKQIDKSLEDDFNAAKKNEIMNWFVTKTKFEPPKSMVENYINNMIEDLKSKSREAKNMEEKQLKEIYSVTAKQQIKWYLIQEKLIEKEQVNISENDLKTEIENQIKNLIDQNPDIRKYFKKPQNKKRFKEEMEIKKLFKNLENYLIIKEVTKSTDQLREDQEKEKKGKK